MEPAKYESKSESEKVISPFADREVVISQKRGINGKLFLVVGIGLLLVVMGALAGVSLMHYLNNPYRTLEDFPVSKYLDSYKGLAGSKFKANFRVEADLGWKEGTGRLMLFSTVTDPRPIVVLIPVGAAKDIYFTKGQTYVAEIEVKEGGLIYANSFEKN